MKVIIFAITCLTLMAGNISPSKADNLYADGDKVFIKKSNGDVVEMKMPRPNAVNGYSDKAAYPESAASSSQARPQEYGNGTTNSGIAPRMPDYQQPAENLDNAHSLNTLDADKKENRPLPLAVKLYATVFTICTLWIIIIAFGSGAGWGFATLFLSPLIPIYVLTHWKEAKKPFLVNLASTIIFAAYVALKSKYSS